MPPATANSSDAAIRQYQARILDPQADSGNNVMAMTPSAHQHMMPAAGTVVAGPLPPAVGGQWAFGPPIDPKYNIVHQVPSPNGGKMLLVAGSGNKAANLAAGTFRSFVWVPSTGERRDIPTPRDLFCSGHVLLPDGRALVVGGTDSYGVFKGTKTVYAFNFTTERYERLTDMEVGRWYPSVINLPDGRTIFVSGLDSTGVISQIAEVFDYRTNQHTRVPGTRNFALYPQMYVAGDGRLFYTGVPHDPQAGFWDPFNGNTYQPVTGLAVPTQRTAATSCFVGDVRDQQMMVMGGAAPATNSTSVIKLDDAAPAYHDGPPLLAAKEFLSCITLPDGTLMEANGGTKNKIRAASTEAALLTNVAGPWEPLNPLAVGEHRLYHSLLFMFDDGSVGSMTSNPSGETWSTSLLIFSPPYLFKGTRPVVNSAPTEIARGGTYAVAASATSGTVTRMTLTAAGAPTHSDNPNQRYMSMPLVNGNFTIPPSANILPPGWYRLWAVDSAGRVSVAKWVHLA